MRLVRLLEDTLLDHGWQSAIRINGKVFEADTHADAYAEYIDQSGDESADWLRGEGPPTGDFEEGFTRNGVYYTRDEALQIWRKENNFSTPVMDSRDWGDSTDLYQPV